MKVPPEPGRREARLPAAEPHDAYASLRLPEYRSFLAAMAAVFVATQVQSAVLGWQVYALTRDPLSLGLVGLSEPSPSSRSRSSADGPRTAPTAVSSRSWGWRR